MTKTYAIIAVTLGLLFSLQELRVRWAQAELLEYQAAASSVITQRLMANQKSARDHETSLKELKHAHAVRISAISNRYDTELERMRIQAFPGRDTLPASTPSTPGMDAGTGERRFVEALRRCEEDRERLRSLQQYQRTLEDFYHAHP